MYNFHPVEIFRVTIRVKHAVYIIRRWYRKRVYLYNIYLYNILVVRRYDITLHLIAAEYCIFVLYVHTFFGLKNFFSVSTTTIVKSTAPVPQVIWPHDDTRYTYFYTLLYTITSIFPSHNIVRHLFCGII